MTEREFIHRAFIAYIGNSVYKWNWHASKQWLNDFDSIRESATDYIKQHIGFDSD